MVGSGELRRSGFDPHFDHYTIPLLGRKFLDLVFNIFFSFFPIFCSMLFSDLLFSFNTPCLGHQFMAEGIPWQSSG